MFKKKNSVKTPPGKEKGEKGRRSVGHTKTKRGFEGKKEGFKKKRTLKLRHSFMDKKRHQIKIWYAVKQNRKESASGDVLAVRN